MSARVPDRTRTLPLPSNLLLLLHHPLLLLPFVLLFVSGKKKGKNSISIPWKGN